MKTSEPQKPPQDTALHALWVIRNWTRLPKGNMESYEEIVRKVNRLAYETLKELHSVEELK